MDLHLKLQGGELEAILNALKTTAEKYSAERLNAFLSGNTKLYLELSEKKSMAWQAYSHIRRAAGIDDPWGDEDA